LLFDRTQVAQHGDMQVKNGSFKAPVGRDQCGGNPVAILAGYV
jgi:hypothetical protein